MVQRAVGTFGTLDIVVNNAGTTSGTPSATHRTLINVRDAAAHPADRKG
jgi:NAD(P)-dependent dehydrogenase (short-subunit alcohol dehydrogenase family)